MKGLEEAGKFTAKMGESMLRWMGVLSSGDVNAAEIKHYLSLLDPKSVS